MTFILGVTGGIASGKSTVTKSLQSFGIDVVDADIVAREVVAKDSFALREIVRHFGHGLLLPSKELNRALLRERIFANKEDKAWLENLLHPIIRASIIQQLSSIRSTYGVLSSPLLFEKNQQLLVDRTLVIDCPEDIQKQRAMQRDAVSEQQILDIMSHQFSRNDRNRLADDIIVNDGSLKELTQAIEYYHHTLTKEIESHVH